MEFALELLHSALLNALTKVVDWIVMNNVRTRFITVLQEYSILLATDQTAVHLACTIRVEVVDDDAVARPRVWGRS